MLVNYFVQTFAFCTNLGVLYRPWRFVQTLTFCTDLGVLYRPWRFVQTLASCTDFGVLFRPWRFLQTLTFCTDLDVLYRPWRFASLKGLITFLLQRAILVLFGTVCETLSNCNHFATGQLIHASTVLSAFAVRLKQNIQFQLLFFGM